MQNVTVMSFVRLFGPLLATFVLATGRGATGQELRFEEKIGQTAAAVSHLAPVAGQYFPS
jgi:hypothetical protein